MFAANANWYSNLPVDLKAAFDEANEKTQIETFAQIEKARAKSIEILTGANMGLKSDLIGDDQGEYDDANRTVRVRLGTGASGTAGGTLAVKAFGPLYLTADSYYNGAEVAGKPRVFMPYAGGMAKYRKICDAVAKDGYRGFALSGAAG